MTPAFVTTAMSATTPAFVTTAMSAMTPAFVTPAVTASMSAAVHGALRVSLVSTAIPALVLMAKTAMRTMRPADMPAVVVPIETVGGIERRLTLEAATAKSLIALMAPGSAGEALVDDGAVIGREAIHLGVVDIHEASAPIGTAPAPERADHAEAEAVTNADIQAEPGAGEHEARPWREIQ